MKSLLFLAALGGFSPLIVRAQESAPPPPSPPPVVVAPPAPPTPPEPPRPPQGHRRPGVFLGVEVTRIPAALSEQLNLPEGFGVLVDYVVPGSAAETAGVKSHDILKLVNDQIITGSEQLSVLIRSFSEGQIVTLVVLHKGQEARLTTTLQRRAEREEDRDEESRPGHKRTGRADDRDGNFQFNFDGFPNVEFTEQFRKEMARNRVQIDATTERALEQAKRSLEEAQERSARAAGSRWDFNRTRVLLRDASGRVELRVAHGKRLLKVRDAQGKTVFDGAIDTPEQRKGIPADVLPQVEALERERETVFPKANRPSEDDARDED